FQLLLKCLKHLNNEINIHEFEDLEEYYIYATPSRGSHYSGVVESCDFFLFDKNLDYTKGFKIRYFSTNSINIQKLMFESDSTDVNINPQNDSLSLSAIYIDKTQENYIRNVLIKFKSQNIDTLINEELLLTDSNQFEFGEFIFHIKDYGVTPIQAYFFNLYNKKYFFID
ncbi:MAG TPA: hypothetical protein VKY32_02640, partial [Flavobacterium sp.]|nr:hypothetical protein [Flavobacterium sp.]